MDFEEFDQYIYSTTINQPQNYFSEWLQQESVSIEQDSISILPSLVDEITNYDWWDHDESFDQSPPAIIPATSPLTSIKAPTLSRSHPHQAHPQFSKKRKHNTGSTDTSRKTSSSKKTSSKSAAGNPALDARWAEQLLNPCAMAIEAGNRSRAQHLIYVLQELASVSGDINHRLAYHGLRTLTRHLYSNNNVATMVQFPPCESPTQSYVTTEAKLFRSTIIKFHEISPWFALPNSLANSTIIKNLTCENSNSSSRVLHIVDLGVSHGVQWPTLLEALTHLPKGTPPIIRLTIVNNIVLHPVPFSVPPPGYNFPSHLQRYAKSINLNLHISQVENLTIQDLTITPGEKLVICAQFRINNHKDVLCSIRELNPDLVILSELDGGDNLGSFPGRFSMNLGMLRRFLDSTCAAFKGRECTERKMMEGEAAQILDGPEIEVREKWMEMMVGLGFREEVFGDESIDKAKALMRKYDGNWEMKSEQTIPAVRLKWKGQPVSFCSIWKPLRR